MPPWLMLKPRWRPLPSHQMRNGWRASESTVRDDKSNTLCRQIPIIYQIMLISVKFLLSKDFAAIHVLVFLFGALVFGAFVLLVKDLLSGRKTPPAQLPLRLPCLCWACEHRLSISVCACVCMAGVNQPKRLNPICAFLIVADDSIKAFTKLLQSNEQHPTMSSTFVLN